jgi:hypothetical protein
VPTLLVCYILLFGHSFLFLIEETKFKIRKFIYFNFSRSSNIPFFSGGLILPKLLAVFAKIAIYRNMYHHLAHLADFFFSFLLVDLGE